MTVVRTRCPGCGCWLGFDDHIEQADQVVEAHTVGACPKPDEVVRRRVAEAGRKAKKKAQ